MSISSVALVSTGLFFHMVSIFNQQGLSPSVVATVYIPIAFATAAANMAGGILTDRIPLRFLLAFGLFLQAAALVLAGQLQGPSSALLFGTILGATSGITRAISTISWPTFFGRKNLGSIYGFSASAGVIGAAVGPIPFGFVYDRLGSYQPVLLILATICFLLSLISLSLKKPVKTNAD
jgi:MFS family permease